MRNAILRRLFFAGIFSLVPLATACELAFDFDRTPLQPVYEGGAGSDSTDAATDGRRGDAGRDA
jgi:hypothetical protein